MIEEVDVVTHNVEILDMIFANNPDQVSSVYDELRPSFTYHKFTTAHVFYQLDKGVDAKETHLAAAAKLTSWGQNFSTEEVKIP